MVKKGLKLFIIVYRGLFGGFYIFDVFRENATLMKTKKLKIDPPPLTPPPTQNINITYRFPYNDGTTITANQAIVA